MWHGSALFLAACSPITGVGEGEYDFAGFIKGEPVEVVKGKATDLPIRLPQRS